MTEIGPGPLVAMLFLEWESAEIAVVSVTNYDEYLPRSFSITCYDKNNKAIIMGPEKIESQQTYSWKVKSHTSGHCYLYMAGVDLGGPGFSVMHKEGKRNGGFDVIDAHYNQYPNWV